MLVPWRGAVAVGAAVALRAAAIFAAFVFCGTAVLGMDCEPRSSAAMAFSPASLNLDDALARFSSRRQASIPVFALIWEAEAGLQKLGRDLLRRGAFQGLRRDEAATLVRRLEQNGTLCVVSSAGELIGIILSVLAALSPSPPRAPKLASSGRGRRIGRHFIGGPTPAGA